MPRKSEQRQHVEEIVDFIRHVERRVAVEFLIGILQGVAQNAKVEPATSMAPAQPRNKKSKTKPH